MACSKVAISIEKEILDRLDRLVSESVFPNRSQAIQAALREKLDRLDKNRLARECAKLNRKKERDLAEEGLAEDVREWPEY
jgi:metal-responsive CopG/Arc/MetJ family transcriptional regulator